MVDTDPVAALPGIGLVIPECVYTGARVAGADRFGQAEVQKPAERSPACGQEKRIFQPGLGLCGILGLGITL